MNILGLDVSTRITGIAILDSDTGAIVYLGHCDTSKINGLVNKASAVEQHLRELNFKVDTIAIEEPLMMYQAGKSSASVISSLSQMNGMTQLLVKQIYDIEPYLWNVSTARKIALPELKYKKGEKRKISTFLEVIKKYPEIQVPLKRTGTPKDFVYDQTDALVIALASANKQG